MNDLQEQLLRASRLVDAQKLDDADKLYREVLDRMPAQADALHGLGIIALKRGQPGIALNYLRRAVGQLAKIDAPKPLIAIFVANLGRAYQLSGDDLSACQHYQHSLNFNRNSQVVTWLQELKNRTSTQEQITKQNCTTSEIPAAFEDLILAHREGKLDIAELGYQRIIKEQPEHSDAIHLLGVVMLQKGFFEQAEALIIKALTLKSEPIYWCNLGLVLNELRRHNEALYSSEQALAQQKDLREAMNVRAIALQALGRMEESEDQYIKILDINPNDADTLNNIAVLAMAQKNYSKAIEFTNKAISIREDFPEAWNNQGNALGKFRKYIEAAKCYRKALELRPNFIEGLYNLGASLNDAGYFEDALSEIGFNSQWGHAIPANLRLIAALSLRAMARWQESIALSSYVLNENLPAYGPNRFPMLRLGVNGAICCWIVDELDLCRRFLNWSAPIHASTDFSDKNFQVYHDYLSRLLEWRQHHSEYYMGEENSSVCYIVGDSHCLSPSGVRLKDGSKVVPRLVMGCKAYHLGHKITQYWRSFEFVTANIPNWAKVIFSFGEIDCRHNEGILKAINSTENNNLEFFVSKLVLGYIDALEEKIHNKEWNVFFQGVPAPNIEETIDNKNKELLINTVRLYNFALKTEATRRGYGFIDISSITSDDSNWSNKKWHIDGHHLTPCYISEFPIFK